MSCCDDKIPQGEQKTGLKGLATGSRRWMLLAAVTVTGSLTLGWDQLVLLGIAPLLVSLLPCLVMCGLGLCIMKCKDKTSKSADQGEATGVQARVEDPAIASTETPSHQRQTADQKATIEPPGSNLQA
ncbi:hypothetical protein [Billgrantia bachuensis]|uniref:hypothetical protein n=1 Tax=Billgrantia bachuensis TaxID=2717286 RepID=UPI00197D47BD|nr:hypothetical protein [Halomonas bachuensis]